MMRCTEDRGMRKCSLCHGAALRVERLLQRWRPLAQLVSTDSPARVNEIAATVWYAAAVCIPL